MTRTEAKKWAKLFNDYANGTEIKCKHKSFYEDVDFSELEVGTPNKWEKCQYEVFTKLKPSNCNEVGVIHLCNTCLCEYCEDRDCFYPITVCRGYSKSE